MNFDAPAQEIYRPDGSSDIILVCEHASNYIPAAYNGLGLTKSQLKTHIAWDIGAKQTALYLSEYLDASLIACNYSRLLFDCNRDASETTAIAEVSENIAIAGNMNLDVAERQNRINHIALPFHQCIADTLATRKDNGRRSIFVTVHSFTPIFLGEKREVQIGLLFIGKNLFASQLQQILTKNSDYCIRANEPYDANFFGAHTLQTHALANHLPNVALEFRQDLIEDDQGQQQFARLTADALLETQKCLGL